MFQGFLKKFNDFIDLPEVTTIKNKVNETLNSPEVRRTRNIVKKRVLKPVSEKADIVFDKSKRYFLDKIDTIKNVEDREDVKNLINNDQDIVIEINEDRDNYNEVVQKFEAIKRLPIVYTIYIVFQVTDEITGNNEHLTFVYNKSNAKRLERLIRSGDIYDITDSLYNTLYEEAVTIPFHDHKVISRVTFTHWVSDRQTQKKQFYKTNNGGFFPFILSPEWIEFEPLLSDFQIFSSIKDKKELELNCLIYALEKSEIIDDVTLEAIRSRCSTRNISRKFLNKIGELYNIKFIIKKVSWDDNKTRTLDAIGDKNSEKIIKLGLIADHYFIIKKVFGISTFYINNKKAINGFFTNAKKPWKIYDQMNIKRYRNDRNNYEKHTLKEQETRGISSIKLIKMLIEHDAFIPITYEEAVETIFHADIQEEFKTLNYSETDVKNFSTIKKKTLINVKSFKEDNPQATDAEIKKIGGNIIYCDFEATTNEKFHVPYAVAYEFKYINKKEFIYGFDCAKKLFQALPSYSIIYFHNLKYDGCFLKDYMVSACAKGNNYYSMTCIFEGKIFYIKDSAKIIPMPLSNFAFTFNISSMKEIFPYNLYTRENIENKRFLMKEADKYEKIPWNKEQHELFETNCKKIGAQEGEYFNLEEYVKFYCMQDVNLLKQGMVSFGKDIKDSLNINIDAYLTISSISQGYFTQNVYKKNPNVFMYGGVLKQYMQLFVRGGRTMCAENKKHVINEEIFDADVNSEYPYSMSQLYLIEGIPQIITDFDFVLKHTMPIEQIIQTEDKYISAFLARIKITKINKPCRFPLICIKKNGVNQYVNEPGFMNVDNIEFFALLRDQEIEYEFIDGMYWGSLTEEKYSGKKDISIREKIVNLYKMRQAYKKQDSTIEKVIKDVLNTSFGKNIQKAHKDRVVYVNKDELQKYISKNDYKVLSIVEDFTKYKSKVIELKELTDEYTNMLFGIQILSYSRAEVMNKMLKFADAYGIYTDTDSNLIPKRFIPEIQKQFEEYYKKPLFGSELGQFSSDFGDDCKCLRGVFVGKKAYYCELLEKKYINIIYKKGYVEDKINLNIKMDPETFKCHYQKKLSLKLARFSDKFEIGKSYITTFKLNNEDHIVSFNVVEEKAHHIRLKGIPAAVIIDYAKKNNITIWDLYMKLYEGEEITFNIASCKVSFKFENLNVSTLEDFTRKIKFL